MEGLSARMVKQKDENGKFEWVLEATLKPEATGAKNGRINIELLKPERRQYSINVSAYIEGYITYTPQIIVLRENPKSKEVEGKLIIKSDEVNFKINSVKDENHYLNLVTKESKKGSEYNIEVKLSPEGKSEQRFSTNIIVETDSKLQPKIKVPVHYYGR